MLWFHREHKPGLLTWNLRAFRVRAFRSLASLYIGFFWHLEAVGFPGGASGKESACRCRRHRAEGLIPGSGRSPGEGNSNPLQCSCLENSMDRGCWWAVVHGVAESWTEPTHTQPLHAPSSTTTHLLSAFILTVLFFPPLLSPQGFRNIFVFHVFSLCLIFRAALKVP